jgi:folate-binding protein YgfZ
MTGELEHAMRARGGVLDEVLGRSLPLHFGDPAREWRAAREGCAVFVAGFRELLAATGEDRVSFLQGMLSNDVKALVPGSGTYASFLTGQGRVVSDLRVYADADRLLLDVLAPRRDALRAGLERFLVADDVELEPPLGEAPLLGLEGPLARPVLTEVLGAPVAVEDPLGHERSEFHGSPLRVVRSSEVGGQGFLLCGSPDVAAALFDACCLADAVALGMRALDVLRVEAGIPWAGVDMDEDVLVIEAGLERALSFRKGCYLGQEVVERIAARGHVNRRLTGIAIEGTELPAPGAVLVAGDGEVGRVTSSVRSELREGVIALGYLRREHLEPGTALRVRWSGREAAATVCGIPFDRPPREP